MSRIEQSPPAYTAQTSPTGQDDASGHSFGAAKQAVMEGGKRIGKGAVGAFVGVVGAPLIPIRRGLKTYADVRLRNHSDVTSTAAGVAAGLGSAALHVVTFGALAAAHGAVIGWRKGYSNKQILGKKFNALHDARAISRRNEFAGTV